MCLSFLCVHVLCCCCTTPEIQSLKYLSQYAKPRHVGTTLAVKINRRNSLNKPRVTQDIQPFLGCREVPICSKKWPGDSIHLYVYAVINLQKLPHIMSPSHPSLEINPLQLTPRPPLSGRTPWRNFKTKQVWCNERSTSYTLYLLLKFQRSSEQKVRLIQIFIFIWAGKPDSLLFSSQLVSFIYRRVQQQTSLLTKFIS